MWPVHPLSVGKSLWSVKTDRINGALRVVEHKIIAVTECSLMVADKTKKNGRRAVNPSWAYFSTRENAVLSFVMAEIINVRIKQSLAVGATRDAMRRVNRALEQLPLGHEVICYLHYAEEQAKRYEAMIDWEVDVKNEDQNFPPWIPAWERENIIDAIVLKKFGKEELKRRQKERNKNWKPLSVDEKWSYLTR